MFDIYICIDIWDLSWRYEMVVDTNMLKYFDNCKIVLIGNSVGIRLLYIV